MCVARSSAKADTEFELWIRDARNHAMGGIDATPFNPGTDSAAEPLTVPAGNKYFSLWEWEFGALFGTSGLDVVNMAWRADPTDLDATMSFTPSSFGDQGDNCSFSGSAQDGAVTYFQCHFECKT